MAKVGGTVIEGHCAFAIICAPQFSRNIITLIAIKLYKSIVL
ncbi:hypothetical protein [Thermosipho melanesiensis]|nr:hypothetical protein [Thermosipho melanesiensis]